MKNDKDEGKKRLGMKDRTQGDTLGRRWQGAKNDREEGKRGSGQEKKQWVPQREVTERGGRESEETQSKRK